MVVWAAVLPSPPVEGDVEGWCSSCEPHLVLHFGQFDSNSTQTFFIFNSVSQSLKKIIKVLIKTFGKLNPPVDIPIPFLG